MKTNPMTSARAAETLFHSSSGLSLGLSMCICLGLHAPVWGLLLGAGFALAGIAEEKSRRLPVYLTFSVLYYTLTSRGMRTAQLALLIAAALLFVSSFFLQKLLPLLRAPVMTGLLFATVLTVTVIQTNVYFGIGASGASVMEMLRTYRSLGFHPNWRGILYGTIVMVVMITVPRKFKRFGKAFSAALLGLVIVFLLNLWLIPDGLPRVVAEIGVQSRPLSAAWRDFAESALPLRPQHAVLCGVALWISQLLSAAALPERQTQAAKAAAPVSALTTPGLLFLPPVAPLRRSRVIAALLLLALACVSAFTGYGVFGRLPAAACGVLLIVGAWQSVAWGKLKEALQSREAAPGFILVVLLTLLHSIAFGCILAAVLSVVNYILSLKRRKEV
ncbi:MAG: hypothetical protein IKD72_00985 [Clostridia bacterium]|nr:hypothetical protein [Clostridia bacterium]